MPWRRVEGGSGGGWGREEAGGSARRTALRRSGGPGNLEKPLKPLENKVNTYLLKKVSAANFGHRVAWH